MAPRPTPGGWTRRGWVRRGAVAGLVGVLAACAGIGSGMIVLAAFQTGLPSVTALPQLRPPRNSELLARDGTLLAVLHEPGAQHIHLALSQVSPLLVEATIAVEDRHFYQDIAAADLPRIVEAAIVDLEHHASVQGASTIPEQLAKISFLTSQKTITRKIREFLLGYEIAKVFKPNTILQLYLNRINYGNQAIGIGSAAELYFHIPASHLDLAQASMLAGIPDAPTAYDPVLYQGQTGPANLAKDRQQVVLEAMVRSGDISPAEANVAFKQPLVAYSWQASSTVQDPNFVQFAEGQLQARFGDAYLNPGGWKIFTSLDPTDQALATSDIQNPTVDARLLREFNIGDASLLSLNPRNGEVLAMVGTTNYQGKWGDINMTTTPRRPGSSFKIYTYSAAIASGKFTMTTPILNEPIDIGGYSPVNYSRTYTGICRLKVCLGNSINVPAVKVEVITGLQAVVNLAERMGAGDLLDPQNTYGDALTLGGLSLGLPMIQIATGAEVLASGGVLHEPTSILQIIQGDRTIYQYNLAQNSVQVLPANVAFIMNEILQSNQNRQPEFGIVNGLTLPGRQVAVKTGTSDYGIGNLQGIGDNWTFGWTPQIVTAAWVGNPNYVTLSGIASGLSGAAPLWQSYMNKVLAGQPDLWYAKPADVIQVGRGTNANYYLPNTVAYANAYVNCPGAYQVDWNGKCSGRTASRSG